MDAILGLQAAPGEVETSSVLTWLLQCCGTCECSTLSVDCHDPPPPK